MFATTSSFVSATPLPTSGSRSTPSAMSSMTPSPSRATCRSHRRRSECSRSRRSGAAPSRRIRCSRRSSITVNGHGDFSSSSASRSGHCRTASDVEADVQDVTVLHHIGLAFELLLACARDLRVGTKLYQVVPADHLAADEAARDVRVDRRRRIERRLAAAERPCTGLLLAGGEEGDQVECLGEPADDFTERRRRPLAAKLCSLLLRELRELGLELQIGPLGAVDDRDQRLRGQRLELARQLLVPVRERVPRIEVREQLLQLLDLFLQRHVTRLRLLRDALEPSLDVVPVGDEQLELQGLEVVVRDASAREPIQDDEKRVDLAEVAEQRGPCAAHLDHTDRRGCHLARAHDLGELLQPRIRDRGHADLAACARTGQRLEQHRLPGARKPDDPDFESHYFAAICFCSDASARCCRDLMAPSVLSRMLATSAFGKLKTNLSVRTCCCSGESFSISSIIDWRPIYCIASSSADGSSEPTGSGTSSSGCQRRRARK